MTKARHWGDLGTRTASALVLAPVAIAAIWIGGWPFAGVIAATGLGMAWEWLGLCRGFVRARGPRDTVGPRPDRGGRSIAVAGLLGIAVWAVALIWLRADPAAGRVNVIGLALVVWGTDIGAYLAGRLIGGPRLAPKISPGKTWAGALGGAAAGVAIAAALGLIQSASRGFAVAALLGLLFSILGQLGDLGESAFKRRCGAKDSGRLIPGHGGLLDRLDATLAVAPAAALLAIAFGRGVVLW